MKIGQQMNFIVINKQASSLYSLIADGKYRATSIGRKTWKTLIGSQASLQPNCNKEGSNAVGSNKGRAKARIGIVSNQENDCASCDSRIGFGTGGLPVDSNTCSLRVEMWLKKAQIMETKISKPWVTSWCSERKTDHIVA